MTTRFTTTAPAWQALLLVSLLHTLVASPSVQATEQQPYRDGFLIEAEQYDHRIYGLDSYGRPATEAMGSDGKVLIGIYQPGMLGYNLHVPHAGVYRLWLRCASNGVQKLQFGVDVFDPQKLVDSNPIPKTTDDSLTGPGAYDWRELGEIHLPEGNMRFVVGTGALRADCFLFEPVGDEPWKVDDAILQAIRTAREKPKGKLLPPLKHNRQITQRPKWLRNALRPAYAHCEWDPEVTVEQWAAKAKAAGANCIVGVGEMPAGQIGGKMTNFSSSLLNDPNFRLPADYNLSYDWVKEYVDSSHRQGMKILIYGGCYRTLDPILLQHPEWRQMGADGKAYKGSGFGSWASPYKDAYIQRWVEVARKSKLDGIMIDMLFTGPTGGDYNSFAVEAFKNRFGVEPPREVDYRNLTWQRWNDFQVWIRENMILELTEALHQVDPEIAVMINQTEGWIFDHPERNFLSTRVAGCADGLLEEMGWEYRWGDSHSELRPWAYPLSTAWQNLFLHCRTRKNGGYGQMWHLIFRFPETHAKALSYGMLANGAAPAVVTGGNWRTMQEIWKHTADCEPALLNAELVPYAALHFSENTLNRYALPQKEDGVYIAYLKNVFGTLQLMLEEHIPVDIITDDDLADSKLLQKYATLVLPNSACLSDPQVAAIGQYMEAGGGLVASSETGCFDENGIRRTEPALADMFHFQQQPARGESTWTFPLKELPEHPIFAHPDIEDSGDWAQGHVEPLPTARLYSGPHERLVRAVPVTRPKSSQLQLRMSGEAFPKKTDSSARPLDLVWRVLVAGEYDKTSSSAQGNGRWVFFPIDLGHAYYVFNARVNRRLFQRALQWTTRREAPPITTDAPLAVQTVLYRQPDSNALAVHLLNDNSSYGRAAAPNPEAFSAFRDEAIPVHEINVAVEGRFSRAVLLPDKKELTVEHPDASVSEVVVPKITIHGVVHFLP